MAARHPLPSVEHAHPLPGGESPEDSFETGSAMPMPSLARKGRGAVSEPGVRYDRYQGTPCDDGWGNLETEQAALPTTLIRDSSRSAISWNDSPDIGFDRAINPYRGCEHGCIYCYARPTHAYLGYSPGLDFETKLLFKPEIANLLAKALSRPSYMPRPIALGSNTDPYQPVERTLRLTRSILEVLEQFGHPLTIVTKSAGVMRDIDILSRLAQRRLVRVYISVTTLDPDLARRMEPRAAAPARRLQAIAALREAGIPVGVMAAPVIPALNDPEMEAILQKAAEAGASQAGYVLLRLPLEVAPMFKDWLEHHFPAKARRVLNLLRSMRGGAVNDPRFHNRFRGEGPYAVLLRDRFHRAVRENGLNGPSESLDLSQFSRTPPSRGGQGAAKPGMTESSTASAPGQASGSAARKAAQAEGQLSLF